MLAVERNDLPKRRRRAEEMVEAAAAAGRRFNTLVDQLGYPELVLGQRLRQRSSLIDLQLDIQELGPVPAGARVVEVYRRTP